MPTDSIGKPIPQGGAIIPLTEDARAMAEAVAAIRNAGVAVSRLRELRTFRHDAAMAGLAAAAQVIRMGTPLTTCWLWPTCKDGCRVCSGTGYVSAHEWEFRGDDVRWEIE